MCASPAARQLLIGVLAFFVASTSPALAESYGVTPKETSSGVPRKAAPVPVGEMVEGVTTAADPSQTYTLYLPTSYSADRTWPALLVFDPRGRGTFAAEIFRDGAERLGWILISSDSTVSDVASWEPNLRAVNALMPELARRWSVDPRRVYAAGMSGTSVLAWVLAQQTGGLAGVIAAAGPRAPGVFAEVESVAFAHLGTVGTADYNFTEMHAMDQRLGELGAPHRLAVFEGAHGWMPPELATEAMAWLEVQAMRQGRRAVAPELVREVFEGELEQIRELERAGELAEALRRYRELAAGYQGLAEVEEELAGVQEKIDELAARPEVARQRKESEHWKAEEARNRRRLAEVARDLRDGGRPVTAEQLLERLEVERLREQVEKAGLGAAPARRMLATIYSQLSFYLRRELWARKAWREAAAVLEVAANLRPANAALWYDLACAHALGGRKKPALEALERAVEAGFDDVAHLEADADLKSLRKTDGYRALVERLRPSELEGD